MDGTALPDERVERFDFIEKKAVINHAPVVVSQCGQSTLVGHQTQMASDRSVVVDQLAIWVFLSEEDAFVIGNRPCQLLVFNRNVGKARRNLLGDACGFGAGAYAPPAARTLRGVPGLAASFQVRRSCKSDANPASSAACPTLRPLRRAASATSSRMPCT